MNLAFEGSIMYKTVAEVRTIIERVLNTTQYKGVFNDPPELEDQPKEKQQLHILSAASSPPPPHIEEITEPPKSLDHEPLIKDMPMFVSSSSRKRNTWNLAMFQPCRRSTSAYAQGLRRSFRKSRCMLRVSAIMSKE